MKKLFAVIISSVLLSFTISAQALNAKVVSVKGKVEVLKANTTAWAPLTEGTTLSRGDIVSTGFNSEAVFSVKESKVTLASLTRMTIEQLTENDKKEQAQFFIDSGKLSASVKHAENKRTDFKVRSPVSTASVRGTFFSVWASGKIAAMLGMVASSKTINPTATVANNDDANDYLPPATSTSVFSSTKKIGEPVVGTPVFAGQNTQLDAISGRFIPPQLLALVKTQELQSYVANLGDSLDTSGLSAITTNSTNKDGSDSQKTGSVVISLNLPNQ